MGECAYEAMLCSAMLYWDAFLTSLAIAFGAIWALVAAKIPFLSGSLDALSKLINQAFAWGGERLQAFGSLAALSFAIYKWWWNRENMLLRRMTAILSERDRRLTDARPELNSIISSPGPGKHISTPLFGVKQLQKVLNRRRWLPIIRTQRLPTAADRALIGAATRLNKLIGSAESITTSRRQELFTTHMLQGALASARSERFVSLEQQAAQNNIARRHFEDALTLPGFVNDRLGRECLGIQLLKLEELQRASALFEVLEADATVEPDPRLRALLAGRAASLRAQVEIKFSAPAASTNANTHLIRAIGYLAGQGPFTDLRDQLQFAKTHELHACVRTHLQFQNFAQSIGDAIQCYQALLATLESQERISDYLFWFIPNVRSRIEGQRAIKLEARNGLSRLADFNAGKLPCVCGHSQPQ
jgi:hypothetical protein